MHYFISFVLRHNQCLKYRFNILATKTYACPAQEGCTRDDECTGDEICVSRQCKCGSIPSCVGAVTGSYCDAKNSICKCAIGVAACHISGETCMSGACVCGNSGRSCSQTGRYSKMLITGETCDAATGVCMCGTTSSCYDSKQGEYCDAENNICKCSSLVSACGGNEKCDGGKCKCGVFELVSNVQTFDGIDASCDGSAHAPYCDTTEKKCRCSASLDCSSQQTCVGEACIGKFKICI